jgi:DNA replication protein DnaC
MQGLNSALKSIANTTYRSEFIRKYTCDGCGELVKVFQLTDRDGNTKENSIGCNCKLIRAVNVQQQMVNQKKIDRIFNQYSLVNRGLLSASFETFKPYCPELAKAVSQARRYADNFDLKKPSNLFFQSSQFGTGKSHLSMSVVRVIKEKGYSAIFISTPKLLTKIRSTYNKNATVSEDELLNNIIAANLVIFDDIGTESAGGWGREKLFEIIDQRLGKNNIFTTNLASDEFLADRDLARIFSRMQENTEFVVMNNVPDYRIKKAK